jgi:hypothetical protein
MNVETVQMDPRVARIKWRDYRDKVKQHREARQKKLEARGKKAGKELGRVRIEKTQIEKEDEELKRLYYQLSKGQTVLHLPKVIGAAGLDKDKLPRLAVCRADFEWCRFDTGSEDDEEEGPEALGLLGIFKETKARLECPESAT